MSNTDTLRENLSKSMVYLSSKISEGYQLIANNPNESWEWYRTMNRDLVLYTEKLEKIRKRYMMITK